jgi:2-oxoglutarate ferredoxin oxidoreductase subunit alpha
LAAEGIDVRMVAPRLLAPVRPEQMAAALEGVKRILVVEQTHGGQFHKYLRAHYDLPAPVRVFHRPGPLPITAGEIHRAITDWR